MNGFKLSLLALGLAAAAPAAAWQAGAVATGTVVKHDQGTEVGTVVRVEGDLLIVKTDKYEVPIPKASTTPHEGALLFGMTREQLNAEVEKQVAALQAALQPGATVFGAAGATAGTVEAADSEFVTLKLTSGKSVRVPRNAIGGSPARLVTSLTAEQLEAAAGAAPAPAAQ